MQNVFNTKVFKVLSKGKDDISYGWKGAGVAVPVFSLKSDNSFGIGDFLDLKLLADWCNKVGLKMIQILPINDTRTDGSWDNSYPYKAISTKALHPIYLNLDKMGQLDDENDIEYFNQQKEILNSKDYVDYPEVMKVKDNYFRKIFAQTWNDIKDSDDYKTFFNENKDWLVPYASFCSQRSTVYSLQSTDNETTCRDASMIPTTSTNIDTSKTDNSSIPEFSYFLQYHLDKQLKETVSYLHEKGIALKGDIPIGIGRDSVEAYTNPELFNLDCQAGAPPDAFATEGQNWGFPTYNWEAMAKDDYKWWRERLTQMSRYFDAYRIDHILGFFRIWEIPIEYSQGTMGHFSPALPLELEIETQRLRDLEAQRLRDLETQRLGDLFLRDKHDSNKFHPRINMHLTKTYNELNDAHKDALNRIYDDYFYHRNEGLWKAEALKKLPKIIEASDMLVCGEDLGMVPACVPEVMQQLNILSLEVQRMPKKFGATFVNPKENPYLSVDTTSTHDTSTIRGWWEENGELTNRFYREMLGHHEGAPYFAEPWVCKEIVKQHLESSSMWTILPIQDYIAMDGDFRWNQTQREQINIPANPHHHWCYKMYQSLEELIERQYLNDMISEMINESGRN